MLASANIPTLNLDLIYGGEGQTIDSWLTTVHRALSYAPEELYLYPLYVRPLTGLDRRGQPEDDLRLEAYRVARDLIVSHGYEQISMRMFRHGGSAADDATPRYCCQEDGMVGLGAGARSYTTSLHYSSEYAVHRRGVRSIVQDYIATPDDLLRHAAHGFRLSDDEQRRRHIIISLLQVDGLNRDAYRSRFRADVLDSYGGEFDVLARRGLASIHEDVVKLTEAGLERSDMIGPLFYSSAVRKMSSGYEWS